MAPRRFRSFAFFTALIAALVSPAGAQDLCRLVQNAWGKVDSYQCTYRAKTMTEGKKTETVMTYTFEKPGKIRMDIQSPRKGAVLIYNPEVSPKVRVRPFPNLPVMVLNYKLTHPRVTSDSGGTVDKSHIGQRLDTLCDRSGRWIIEDARTLLVISNDGKKQRYSFGPEGFLRSIQVLDNEGEVAEIFEWTDLKVNPALDPDLFRKF